MYNSAKVGKCQLFNWITYITFAGRYDLSSSQCDDSNIFHGSQYGQSEQITKVIKYISSLSTHNSVIFELQIPDRTMVQQSKQSTMGCTTLYQSVLRYTKVYQGVPKFTRVYLGIPDCRSVYKSVLECTRVYKSVPECTRVYKSVPEFTRVHQNMPECTRVYQSKVQ